MISIVICSRINAIDFSLSENIKSTIGFEYELIVIDNSQKKYSIFEAYNLGIEKSKGNYLCFIHDDILFHTQNWGSVVNRIFEEDKKIGLIGVAGAKIKTKTPSAWWDCPEDQKVMHIIQHFSNNKKELIQTGFSGASRKEVVVIDGVFMALRKVNNIKFYTEILGFHNYDLNISLEYIKNRYKIVVTNEILVEHFSFGVLNKAWVKSTYEMHRQYKDLLPLVINKEPNIKELEKANLERFINWSLKFDFYTMAISFWVSFFCLKPKSKFHYKFWTRIIKNKLC